MFDVCINDDMLILFLYFILFFTCWLIGEAFDRVFREKPELEISGIIFSGQFQVVFLDTRIYHYPNAQGYSEGVGQRIFHVSSLSRHSHRRDSTALVAPPPLAWQCLTLEKPYLFHTNSDEDDFYMKIVALNEI